MIEDIQNRVTSIVRGQEAAVEGVLLGLLAGGHVLIEGVPGIGKTLLAKTLASVLDLSFARVQFTPDLLPSDITGSVMYDMKQGDFRIDRGPVFTNVLLADEVNRTPPKTQAALLEAMEEGHVTLYGQTLSLPDPFLVLATQNPIEYEGTYPLPEAQLDRFLLKVQMDYPDLDAQCEILERFAPRKTAQFASRHERDGDRDDERDGDSGHDLDAVVAADAIKGWRRAVWRIEAAQSVLRYMGQILEATRAHPDVRLGASPRAGTALLMASRALAFLRDRTFITPDDVKEMAVRVLGHRILLTPGAELEGVTVARVIDEVFAQVAVPR
ncbi:MAG: AAA family ATPase [Firmicutes bacterium]|nr:AAA family ATPase [Bacillota bacterium]